MTALQIRSFEVVRSHAFEDGQDKYRATAGSVTSCMVPAKGQVRWAGTHAIAIYLSMCPGDQEHSSVDPETRVCHTFRSSLYNNPADTWWETARIERYLQRMCARGREIKDTLLVKLSSRCPEIQSVSRCCFV